MSKLGKREFDFIGKRKIFLFIALGIILAGIIVNIVLGTELDINFQGGTMFNYSYTGDINTDDVDALATETIGKEVTVELRSDIGGELKQMVVTLADKEALSTELQTKMNDAIAERFKDNSIEVLTTSSVKPTIGSGFFIKCIFAIVLGAIFVTIYVGIRFRKIGGLSAGVFATLCLLHDIIIAYFVYVIFRIPLDDNFIAVVLTILGYSLNGTIVIYDRIRENERLFGRSMGISEIVNKSVNQTVTRNLNTTLATFSAVVVVAVVSILNGIDSIVSFAIPMSVGVIAGCYSSVLLSSPLWAMWREHKLKKEEQSKKDAKGAKGKKAVSAKAKK